MSKWICSFCNVYVYDSVEGDLKLAISNGLVPLEFPELWKCPVCGQPKTLMVEISDDAFIVKKAEYEKFLSSKRGDAKDTKDIIYYRDKSRQMLAGVCAVNKVCDGNPDRICMGMKYGKAIGFGGAGQGRTFDANFKALEKYKFKMRVIKKHHEPEMSLSFFGTKIKMPVLVSSISGVRISMNDSMDESEFQRGMVEGAKIFGTVGLSGNTVDFPDHPGIDVIKKLGGWGIPVFKPQEQERLLNLFSKADDAGVLAIGVDLDGYGSSNWAVRGKPVYRKSEEELKELVRATKRPVIFKGIMSVEDARIAVNCGAKAIDVSNHGGRVLDWGQGVADVLPDIASELKGDVVIMADGAVRTGFDALKVLALGADVVLIGRPLARMSLAGGASAVNLYLDYVMKELRIAMLMTGCDALRDITPEILVEYKC